jgi:hypothetical protein
LRAQTMSSQHVYSTGGFSCLQKRELSGLAKVISPLLKGEQVEVRRLAPENACTADMLVQIRWHGRKMAVPLSQLAPINVDESTTEAIGDWHYWVAQGYSF